MLKKILLALDHSEAGLAAQRYALELAKSHGALITALGIVDVPWITASQPEPLGGGAFRLHRDEAVIRLSRVQVTQIAEDFRQKCLQEKLSCEVVEVEGFPAQEIEKASQEHDLILMGKTTDFHFDLDEDTDITVRHVARDHPRPLLIIPKSFYPIEPEKGTASGSVVVCWDGGLRSSRSLHIFLLLGLGKGKRVQVVTVTKEKGEADDLGARGVHLCQAHGVQAERRTLVTSQEAGAAILELTGEMQTDLIVMGAFGHMMLREAFFGSATKILMKKSEIPLFLYH